MPAAQSLTSGIAAPPSSNAKRYCSTCHKRWPTWGGSTAPEYWYTTTNVMGKRKHIRVEDGTERTVTNAHTSTKTEKFESSTRVGFLIHDMDDPFDAPFDAPDRSDQACLTPRVALRETSTDNPPAVIVPLENDDPTRGDQKRALGRKRDEREQETDEESRRETKRQRLEDAREARLRALADREEEYHDDERAQEIDEPDESILNLMSRTAKHLLTSPNPIQLEARILANHGSDPRFAFLRGKWKEKWDEAKMKAKKERDDERARQSASAALGAVGGYESD